MQQANNITKHDFIGHISINYNSFGSFFFNCYKEFLLDNCYSLIIVHLILNKNYLAMKTRKKK